MSTQPVIASLVAWMEDSGVPHRVTSTLRSDPRSFHSQGLAVDFAGPEPGRYTDELLAVYRALEPLGPDCLELIYAHYGWKNGRLFRYSPAIRRAHANHVHVAMPADWRYEQTPSGEEVSTVWQTIPVMRPWWGLFRRRQARATG